MATVTSTSTDVDTIPEHLRDRAALKVPEFAAALGISRAGAYNLVARGAVRSVTIASSRRIPVSELRRLLEEGAR